MTENNTDFIHKIVLLGDSLVGKTSLVQRYVYDSLSPDVGRTIGAVLHVKKIELDGDFHKLVIWDLGGQESFAQLREQFSANASGAFFIFDRTRLETLQHIDSWLNALYTSAGKIPVIAVENKIDLESMITSNQIKGMLDARGLMHLQTSAVENTNVNSAYIKLVQVIMSERSKKKE
ncbi:GTP-binding protein [Candidatus Thorarchaeota archaeon]|nr:GTP-binding protein [Candidatus Thorarchaeota archaeon]TFG96908.1 MAG: GTP-binding protein [Candidatus Thorarchaeota archaeon]